MGIRMKVKERTTPQKRAKERGRSLEYKVAKAVHGVRVGRSKAVKVNGKWIQTDCQRPPDVVNAWASFECKSRKDLPKWFTDGMTQAIRNAPNGFPSFLVIYCREDGCYYITSRFEQFLDLHER
jgi:hypothetical protein